MSFIYWGIVWLTLFGKSKFELSNSSLAIRSESLFSQTKSNQYQHIYTDIFWLCKVHLNVNGLTFVNVSFEITSTKWLQLQWPPGSLLHLIQHWQLHSSKWHILNVQYIVAYLHGKMYINIQINAYSPIQLSSLLFRITGVVGVNVFTWQRFPVHCDGQLEKERKPSLLHNHAHTDLNGSDNSKGNAGSFTFQKRNK